MTYALLRLLISLGLLLLPSAVHQMALAEGVNADLAVCIVEHESHWNTALISKDMDTGLFQIIPSTAVWAAEKLGWSSYDLTDPVTNIEMGLYILKYYPEWYSTLYLCEE
jgi:soluble lytic murein transglycosylase-like protein